MNTKICTGCGGEFPATSEYFNRKGQSNDTLRTKCKGCEKAYRLKNVDHKRDVNRAYRLANHDAIAKKKAAYRQANKTRETERYRKWLDANREHFTQYQKDYTRKRKAVKSEYDKQYREKNRSEIIARQYRWKRENIEHTRAKGRAATARHNARKKRAQGSHTADDINRIYKSQKGRCYYCGQKLSDKYHVDHVVPLSRGGSNSPDNLVISCPHCNVTKNARMPHEWPEGGRLL